GDQHRDSGLPLQQAGAGEAAHESDGAEDIDDVVDVEAVAWTLLVADAGERAVEAVAKPVEDEAEDDEEQCEFVKAGERVGDAGSDLRAEAKKRELVGGEPGGGAFRKVVKGAFFGGSGERAIDAAGGDEGHGWNRGGAHGWSFLFTEGVAGGAECEFERFAGDGLDERADGPAEAAGNGARQRNGFDLHGQAAVVLLVTPVSVLAPEEAVGVGGAEGMFCRRACTVDLGDIRAARDAVAMAKVEVAEVDIVGGIHNNGDDMVLADSHERLEAVVVPGESFGLEDFGREVLWVRVEVAHQAFEVGGGGSGDEGSAAPVVKEGSGDGGWGKLLDDEVAAAEATLVCGDEE